MFGENWHVREESQIVEEHDYKQSEIISVLEAPSKEQLRKIDRETSLFCFDSLKGLIDEKEFEKIQFGVKIGCKLSQPEIKWVEKWATFEVGYGHETVASTVVDTPSTVEDPAQVYKYFSKFWMEGSVSLVKGEAKL